MTETNASNYVLSEILQVLQRIEVQLEGHEARFKSLEAYGTANLERVGTGASEDTISSTNKIESLRQTKETPQHGAEPLQPSRKGSPANEDPSEDIKSLKVPYGQWSINQLDSFFNLYLSPSLIISLGDCWQMPDDNRLPLQFFKTNILKVNAPWGLRTDSYPTNRQPLEDELSSLCRFDREHRKQPGNDFVVVDFGESDNTRIYRLGDGAIGAELQVEAQGSQSGPWSRLV